MGNRWGAKSSSVSSLARQLLSCKCVQLLMREGVGALQAVRHRTKQWFDTELRRLEQTSSSCACDRFLLVGTKVSIHSVSLAILCMALCMVDSEIGVTLAQRHKPVHGR